MNINKNSKIDGKFTLENLYDKYDGNEHLVGIWHDGNKLYGRLLSVTSPVATVTGTYANAEYNFPEMKIPHILWGYIKYGNRRYPIPYTTNAEGGIKAFFSEGILVVANSNKDWSNCTCWVYVEYTKN